MMRTMQRIVTTLAFCLPAALSAQAAAQAAAPSLKKDIIAQISDAEKKLIALANAIPADKFSWSPTKEVRSVSEVFVHVAMENYAIPPMVGLAAAPSKVADDAEKTVTTKAAVIDMLTKSFAYARQSVQATPDAQMDVSASYFGTPMSKRGILMALASHGHEHLGQMIAYARLNSIVPPWSQ
jgi:uncharacterized damage-inducible protein DinB